MSGYSFHPLARDELENQVAYDEARSRGLGMSFAVEVRATIAALVDYPESGSPSGAGTRSKQMSRFPFIVGYLPPGQVPIPSGPASQLLVVAIAHVRRAPAYWSSRTNMGTEQPFCSDHSRRVDG